MKGHRGRRQSKEEEREERRRQENGGEGNRKVEIQIYNCGGSQSKTRQRALEKFLQLSDGSSVSFDSGTQA